MMWYNGPRHHRYYRGYRGSRFPWMILPVLFFFFAGGHLWWLLPASFIGVLLFIALRRMAWSATSIRNQQTSYNPPTYYQPPTQNNAQSYYEPYYQGYRAPTPAQSPTPEYYTPEGQQEDPYQAYDQPKAEYPQQMPPM